ncbi:hypothetical protein ACLOJK_014369 [Asimina triloba]
MSNRSALGEWKATSGCEFEPSRQSIKWATHLCRYFVPHPSYVSNAYSSAEWAIEIAGGPNCSIQATCLPGAANRQLISPPANRLAIFSSNPSPIYIANTPLLPSLLFWRPPSPL